MTFNVTFDITNQQLDNLRNNAKTKGFKSITHYIGNLVEAAGAFKHNQSMEIQLKSDIDLSSGPNIDLSSGPSDLTFKAGEL